MHFAKKEGGGRDSCYAGSRWSLNKCVLSLFRKMESDSTLICINFVFSTCQSHEGIIINIPFCPDYNIIYSAFWQECSQTNAVEYHSVAEVEITTPLWESESAQVCTGRLWFRGGVSISLSEGYWISSPSLHVEVSLVKILKPKRLLMCWSAPCLAATAISQCMYELP